MKFSDKALGYIAASFKSIIYGSTVIFVGQLLNHLNVFDLLGLRFLLSAGAFILLSLLGVVKVNFKNKNIKILIATAIFEPVLYFLFETLGIESTDAIIVGVLAALLPVFVVVFETIFLKEHTGATQRFYLGVRVLGALIIVVLSGTSGHSTLRGIIFTLISVISGALFLVSSRKASQDFNAIEITFFSNVLGAVVFNTISVVRHLAAGNIGDYFTPLMSWQTLAPILFLALISSVLATGVNNYALSKIPASLASAFGGLTTVTTIFLGVVVNHEEFRYYHAIGVTLILIGILGMSLAGYKRKN